MFRVFVVAVTLLIGIDPAAASETERPNVVWIIADDLSPELGCYGYKGVATPNIDRLAERGTRYTEAFATAPVCSASRSALITGVYQTTTGTHQHRTLDKPLLAEPAEPITEMMRRAGYFVCNSNSAMNRSGKTDYNFVTAGKMYDAPDWARRTQGQPFFAQVQIHEPHRDFAAAKDRHRANRVSLPAYYPEHPVIRADWANYLATIEILDERVGAVIDRLHREGVADNTVIFFFGDHGRPHYRDKQWLYDGGIRVPLVVSWPRKIQPGTVRSEMVSLIDVSAATLVAAGLAVPEWMHGRDMLAKDFAGRKMIFAARDRCGNTVDRIRCVRTERFKYIRNFFPDRPYAQHSGYKELQYPGMTVARVLKLRGELTGPPALFWTASRPAEELYDLAADPEELHNLASDTKHTEILSALRSTLNEWIEQTDDRGRLPEATPERIKEIIASSDRWYRGRMEQRGLAVEVDPESYLRWWQEQLGLQ